MHDITIVSVTLYLPKSKGLDPPVIPKFSRKPWEFDIGWMYIKSLEWLGLAKIKR